MSQRKRRAGQWKRQDPALMGDLEVRARFMARRFRDSANDLLQEASLAIWQMSPDEVATAADAIDLQRRVGEAAMRGSVRSWRDTKGVEVISLDHYLEEEERRAELTEDEWGAPPMPRRVAA